MLALAGALAAVVLGITLGIRDLDEQIEREAGPQEGYYWSASQYQIALQRVRELVRAAAAGEYVDDEEIERRVNVLHSKIRLLTTASELTNFLRRVPPYAEATKRLQRFHELVDPLIETPQALRTSAKEALPKFYAINETVIELANGARTAEMEARGTALGDLLLRRRQFWWALWTVFAVLVGAIATITWVWSRYRRALGARERAVKEAHEALEARSEFLGMVSHELRSPLQSIVAALDVLESGHTSASQAHVMKRIRRSATELAAQLRDMLTLARGEAGRIELRPDTFDAAELVREIADEMRPQAEGKRLAMSVITPPEAVFVVADYVRIGQLVQNLLSNAIKFTTEGSVSVLLRDFDERAGQLVMVVADTGPGLPRAAHEAVTKGLRPSTMRSEGGGRGIGLAVVHALVGQLGGKIVLGAISSQGTSFVLSIPAALADDMPGQETAVSNRLLIVDDREDLRHAFADMAAELGVPHETAASAAAALNLLAAHTYSCVLIDLEMPGTGGAAFAAALRRNPDRRGLRLIAMSAGRGPGDAERQVFDAVLEKPFGTTRLKDAMAR